MGLSYIDFIRQSLHNRGLVYVLSQRQLKSRYRKSVLGVFWSLLNPLITTLVLWVIFVQVFSGRFNLEASYAVYVYSGILFTNLIQGTIPQIGDSVTATGALAGKVKANPLIFIYASTISGLLNFLIGLSPLIILNQLTGSGISYNILMLVPFLFITVMFVSSIGIFVAQLYSKYHDTQNIVGVGLMLLSYVTPIFYPLDMLQGVTKEIISWNPLTILLSAYRYAVMDYGNFEAEKFFTLVVLTFLLFICATYSLYRAWPRMVARL
jgi:ABC-type polysaccharide/polyol phosphate export permease